MRRTNEKIIDDLKLELLERIAAEIRKKYNIDGTKKVLYLYKRGMIIFTEAYDLLEKIKATEDCKAWKWFSKRL